MIVDAAQWWPLVGPHLNISRESERQRVHSLLASLPHNALTAFEIRLGQAPGGTPDISQRIDNAAQAAWLLAREPNRFGSLLRRWTTARQETPAGFLAQASSLWLEFDLHRTASPSPVSCLRLPRQHGPLDAWLPQLVGHSNRVSQDAQGRTLANCQVHLPNSARPLYLFDLSARRPALIRLEILGIGASQAPSYLDRIGAPVPGWLMDMVDLLGIGQRPHLSFDIHADGSFDERIGFEVSFLRLPHREPRWQRLVEDLVDGGLCHTKQAQCLFDWPSQTSRPIQPKIWPMHPALHKSRSVRVISHIKVAGCTSSSPEAKGYYLHHMLDR